MKSEEEYISYTYRIKIRFKDMDSYGIVHHSNYFSYFEEARCHFAADFLDIPYDMIDGQKAKFPVIEAYCKYINSVNYKQDELVVKVLFRIIASCKLEFLYTLEDDCGNIYVKGKTIHAFMDEKDKLCLRIPEWFEDKVASIKEQMESNKN
jgi:acyl-CoA thioester hydrolase